MAHELTDQASNAGTLKGVFRAYRYFWVSFVVIVVDQLVKLLVKFNMQPGEDLPIAGEAFRINFIENKGAAFGLTIADILAKVGIELSEDNAKVMLTIFSIGAVVVIVYLLNQVRQHRSALPFFLALILGGAIGNIIDRVFYGVWFAGMNWYEGGLFFGRVVDMFYLDLYRGEIFGVDVNLWPVFNIADLAIFVGIGALILFQRRFFRKHQEAMKAEEGENAGESTVSEPS